MLFRSNVEFCPSAGTVFKVAPSGDLTTLYSFCAQNGCSDGQNPYAALIQATNGVFYGTTTEGGFTKCEYPLGCGTIYSVAVGLGPFVSFVHNPASVGQTFGVLGQGLTGTSNVSLNGTPATFTVKANTLLEVTVPNGATTGYVTVTTPSGTLTSNVPFHVIK